MNECLNPTNWSDVAFWLGLFALLAFRYWVAHK